MSARVCSCLLAAFLLSACAGELPPRWTEPTTKMTFALIPAGDVVVGSPSNEPGHQADEVLYPVHIGRPFYISTHEVTRRQWTTVMEPGRVLTEEEAHLPAVDLTWHEARLFVDKLNADQPWRCRLPSEVEWEYVCRAGTTTAYSTGAALSTGDANYNGDFPSSGRPAGENPAKNPGALPVGTFAPNQWGLFDMHGNVWEWTNDAYDETRKVIRGGSWRFNADSARCALRYQHRPEDRGDSVGLRLVRDLTNAEVRQVR